MRRIVYVIIFSQLFTILPTLCDNDQEPEGIDSDGGEAEAMYNKTYKENQSKLDADLWKNYKTNRIPVKNASRPIDIMMHWHLTHISIVEADQTMTIHGHLYMTWFDEFLGWDPANYNGIRQTRCKKWHVWSPKVRIANSISGVYSNFDISGTSHVIVASYGTEKAKIEMYPTFAIRVGCNMDFSDYPNDVHNCTSSAYVQQPMSKIKISPYFITATLSLAWDKLAGGKSNKMSISNFKVINVTTNMNYYRNGTYSNLEPFTSKDLASTWSIIHTTVLFKRNTINYVPKMLMPCIASSMLNTLPFIIPNLGAAIYISVFNLVMQFIFINDIFYNLPMTATTAPKIVKFFGYLMSMNLFTLIVHVIFYVLLVINLPAPPFLQPIYKAKDILPELVKKRYVQDKLVGTATWQDLIKIVRLYVGIFLGVTNLLLIIIFSIF